MVLLCLTWSVVNDSGNDKGVQSTQTDRLHSKQSPHSLGMISGGSSSSLNRRICDNIEMTSQQQRGSFSLTLVTAVVSPLLNCVEACVCAFSLAIDA
uniref:Secreted protein n=1 Tax=Mesocestoides corti TaxID=53468 RepID=A0A5K3FGA3_MESCO